MTLSEKIELIQSSSSKEILNGGGHNGTPLLRYVFEIHEEVFGMPCKTCSSLLPRYIAKIQNINPKLEIMSTKERQYRMKSGSVIHVRGTNNYYSDLNLTDEVAEKLLKVNPNRSALFAKIPEGALERIQKEVAEEAEAAEKAKADEAARVAKEREEAEKANADANPTLKKVEDAPADTDAPAKDAEVNEAEEVKTDEAPAQDAPAEKADEDLTFTELREKYPDIKARSKEGFLKDLAESRTQA